MSPGPGKWISIGPTRIDDGELGSIGRIHSIAVNPVTPTTLYVGGPRCGIWKTTDGGGTWMAVGDGLPTLALAALAVDPVTPARVYAVMAGDGIYCSEDDAGTWRRIHVDLGAVAGSSVLLIDPMEPSCLYLTVGERGLFRSTNYGIDWKVAKNGSVGDLAMDQSNPGTLYAAVPLVGVYKTMTGGAAGDSDWTKLPGLPASGFKRVTVALSPALPTTVYAGLTGDPFRLYRSTDGTDFELRYTAPSSLYNPGIGVDPADPSIVYLLSADFRRSIDGGASFEVTSADPHECQEFAADPRTAGVIYVGRDNGLFRSPDRGVTFKQIGDGISNVEFYDGALAATNPGLTIGGTQDNGTISYDGEGSRVWKRIHGGDGGTVAVDPTDAEVLYAMNQYAPSIVRSTDGGKTFQSFAAGLPTDNVCFNLQFFVHPTAPATLLAACRESLWRIQSPGPIWEKIFTLAGDSVVRAAVDPSIDLYYVGLSSGKLYAGLNAASWQPAFEHPGNAAVKSLRVDPDDGTVVYATFAGNGEGRVYRMKRESSEPVKMAAADITSNLPVGLELETIAVDLMKPATVYVGTSAGAYRGVPLGEPSTWRWDSYDDGMPPVEVKDLEVHPTSGVMRAVTFGRGAYEVCTDWPIGTTDAASGRIALLRVHDVGTGWGPPHDFLDAEVVIRLDTMPQHGFGFMLRSGSEEAAQRGMLDLLRDAFARNSRITIDYVKTGLRNGRIVRVVDMS